MKLVVLDRDGVINQDSDDFIKSAEEWIPIPGSLEAIARLNQAGWRVVVTTNQSGLARGLFDLDDLNRMHARMHQQLAAQGGVIDAVLFCPHGPDDGCRCRKPLPGMLETLAERLGHSLEGVPVVGDSLRDLEAAQAVGARPCLVRTGKGERTLAAGEGLSGVDLFEDLAHLADHLLHHRPPLAA